MQTVDKAISLLNLFSVSHPEIGLSELARLAGFDKAATRRFLVALQKHQFIEQNPDTKAYRLGTGFLHLARIREASFPMDVILQQAVERLTAITGETAHAALMSNERLATSSVSFPARANRVHLEVGEILPLHATASGLVFCAFSSPELQEKRLAELKAYTARTETRPEYIRQKLAEFAAKGYAVSDGGFEDEVTGMAVPFFDTLQQPLGTLAVAAPGSRMTAEVQAHYCGTVP
ncbi:MAG: IclR family transcriptional regulator [Thiolinea sp.]